MMNCAIKRMRALRSWALLSSTRIFFSSILAVATLTASVIAIYPPIGEDLASLFDREISELKVIGAHLQPRTDHFFSPVFKDFNEVVEVRMRLKNFSNDDILITSMEAVLEGHSNLRFATASARALGERPEENSPVLIGGGKEAELIFRSGLKLAGITPFFEKAEFKDEFFSETRDFYMLHDLTWIPRLNKQLANLYGEDASLEVRFFTGYKKLVKTHYISFSEGEDLFDRSGRLQHDKFMGAIRYVQNKNACKKEMQDCIKYAAD
jgi:hypothetical protein